MLIWTIILAKFLSSIHYSDLTSQFLFAKQPSKLYTFIAVCIAAPLWEELAFRHAPLQMVKNTGNVLWVIIITSAIFGYIHPGSNSVLFQGVYGLIFAWVYIRNNYCYWSSTFLHFLWNVTMMFAPLTI